MIHNTQLTKVLCSIFFFAISNATLGQGLIVNEISNGRFANREYIELLVLKDCPSDNSDYLDIRGWIIDDNNGDFACESISNVGIRTGHIRFDSSGNWDSIPFGSMILVYNNVAKNQQITQADDPTDANGDGVYILPASFNGIEYKASCPRGAGSCGNVSNFADSTYDCSLPYYNGNPWDARVRMRDEGDAMQTRRPDGTYFHGISWGFGDIAGGPDNLLIATGIGTHKSYYFNTGNPRDVANFDSTYSVYLNPGLQTPGLPNNPANQNFIDSIQTLECNVILPVLLAGFSAEAVQEKVNLSWTSVLEINSRSFVIERADHGSNQFKEIARVDALGEASGEQEYHFVDANPCPGTSFYRLRMLDVDGSSSFSGIRSVTYLSNHVLVNIVYPNPVEDIAYFDVMSKNDFAIGIFDMTGRQVALQSFKANSDRQTSSMDLSMLDQGMYVYLLRSTAGVKASGRLLKR